MDDEGREADDEPGPTIAARAAAAASDACCSAAACSALVTLAGRGFVDGAGGELSDALFEGERGGNCGGAWGDCDRCCCCCCGCCSVPCDGDIVGVVALRAIGAAVLVLKTSLRATGVAGAVGEDACSVKDDRRTCPACAEDVESGDNNPPSRGDAERLDRAEESSDDAAA